ncbi:hypothetical protein MLP_19440 [Microlunatus phosphovorus NM-1]|uniref:N-acetyltransferase domain-containing protein n=1 Tax=Microlunatus phosphovorus (strain ATCC 700054 / DSM 10555 / JCM 9379 / NBRC 101784 / NCIMB 13414 / VKM Ac-1990 / NM-1) TaxID=1032480 RepID=F5XT86_MICPN|nr:GNAT family N-acetyltransferase [Microlunatus phosphovorus]BAK34958.1 hypothetical protein MLP_19440 [Microlunatus phosphovorus NM-1]
MTGQDPRGPVLCCRHGAFRREIAHLVGSWAVPAEDAVMWGITGGGPVPADDVLARAADPGVTPFTLHDVVALRDLRCSDAMSEGDGRLVGYGELWVDDGEAEVEVARLIVDPTMRGRGIGAYLARELARRAQSHYPDVYLRVRPDNAAARRCYANAGYRQVDTALQQQWNIGQPLDYAWYAYPLVAID